MITPYEIRQICRIAHAIEHEKLRQSKKHGLMHIVKSEDLYKLFPDKFVPFPIDQCQKIELRMDLIFLPKVIILDYHSLPACNYIITRLLEKYCHIENRSGLLLEDKNKINFKTEKNLTISEMLKKSEIVLFVKNNRWSKNKFH